jgi:hypothetical protein
MGRQPLQIVVTPHLAQFGPLGLHGAMHELMRTNDIVLLGAVEALLESAGLDCLIADEHISALEGMIGAFPRRLLVREADRRRARALLVEAGFGAELRDE